MPLPRSAPSVSAFTPNSTPLPGIFVSGVEGGEPSSLYSGFYPPASSEGSPVFSTLSPPPPPPISPDLCTFLAPLIFNIGFCTLGRKASLITKLHTYSCSRVTDKLLLRSLPYLLLPLCFPHAPLFHQRKETEIWLLSLLCCCYFAFSRVTKLFLQ